MAKATTIKVSGTCNWAKVFEENRDMIGYKPVDEVPGTYEECDGAYTVDLILSPEEFGKLKDAGSMKTGTPTDEGIRVKVERKHGAPYSYGGKPKVTDAEGKVWTFDEDGTIGNGSSVTATLTCYHTKFGTVGTRLETLKVTEHVPYEPEEYDEDETEVQQESVMGG